MNRKHVRLTIFMLCMYLLVYYVGNNYGYSLIEGKAIRNSYPFQEGKVMYQNDYNDKKVVIWKTDSMNYVKLLDTKWGVLHRVSGVAQLYPREPSDAIIRTWSASLNSKKMYETIFAVEVVNPEIKRVIVSNDNIDDVILEDINQIKEKSSLFLELIVKDGFAASYNELDINVVGGFVFRGLNEKGEIVTVGR